MTTWEAAGQAAAEASPAAEPTENQDRHPPVRAAQDLRGPTTWIYLGHAEDITLTGDWL